MYSKIRTRAGDALILTALINEIKPLFEKTVASLNHQESEEDLLCWIYDVFSDDFEDEYGHYSEEYLRKFALCVLNARHYLIRDKEEFCNVFNNESLDLKIGYDGGFYPSGIGHWIDVQEFVVLEA